MVSFSIHGTAERPQTMSDFDFAASALRTIGTEVNGLKTLANAIEGDLGRKIGEACEIIRGISGRVIVTGVGKSGHVGGKLAATLASTGTPAFFVHPSEANHGDLGMIARDDVVVALSWSGETQELKGVLAYSSRFQIPLVAITRNSLSALGLEATVCLELPRSKEACPNGLAPTTSTTMQMAVGDALSVALLESRGFSADDFGIYHPGGSLGANLSRVSDIMHKDDRIPLVQENASMPDAIMMLSDKRFGCVGIVNATGNLIGVFTDGDLARNLDKNFQSLKVDDLMTREPKTISKDALVSSAMAMLEEFNISALIVTNGSDDIPVGIVHLHDLLRIGAA